MYFVVLTAIGVLLDFLLQVFFFAAYIVVLENVKRTKDTRAESETESKLLDKNQNQIDFNVCSAITLL